MSERSALRSAARALGRERVVATVARAFEALGAPISPWRARLAGEHGVYSPEVVELGLCEGLRDWDERRLRALIERELPPRFAAPELTVVWLAGSIPTACFSALALPLLVGSAVFAKAASADRCSPALFAALLAELDPALAAAIQVSNGRDRARDLEWLRAGDAVAAYGSDATIRELTRELSPHQRFVAHGHKLSVAAVGSEIAVEPAAARAALELALWDGRGCLSPAWLFVLDRPRGRAEAFARALYRELAELAGKLPRGPLTGEEEAALREWRARGAMRAGARALFSEPATGFGVVLAEDAPEPGTLRNVPVVPIQSLDQLAARCLGLRPQLSTLAHAGFASSRGALERIGLRAGASRLCPLGRMQRPPLDWNHDGVGALRPLIGAFDVEDEA